MSYKKYNKEGTDWDYAVSPFSKTIIALAAGLFAIIILLWIIAVVVGSGTIGGVGGILLLPMIALAIWGIVRAGFDLDEF